METIYIAESRDLIHFMRSEMASYSSKVKKICHSLIGEICSTLTCYFEERQEQNKRFNGAGYAAQAPADASTIGK